MWKKYFCSDWIATKYHLDTRNIDGIKEVYVNGVLKTNETNIDYDSKYELATFVTASTESDNVVSGYIDRILKCTLLFVFDNRVLFSGNRGYPNLV